MVDRDRAHRCAQLVTLFLAVGPYSHDRGPRLCPTLLARAPILLLRRWPLPVLAAATDGYPGWAGGPWLCSTFVLSGFQALVVPSGFRTSVQPHLWMTI